MCFRGTSSTVVLMVALTLFVYAYIVHKGKPNGCFTCHVYAHVCINSHMCIYTFFG